MVSPTIRLLAERDIAPALELCRSAGWNQLHADWSRLMEYQPDGCFVALLGGKLVGTVTTTLYAAELGWIGMMLVHPEYRRRGIGTQLMNASLAYLRDTGVACIKLDATPDGKPVYEKLGFQCEWSYHRWQIERASKEFVGNHRSRLRLDQHAPLDLQAFGVDRRQWLERLSGGSICVDNARGFGMIRPGYLATYLGPVTAADVRSAEEIIAELLSHAGGKVFWDVPQVNQDAVNLATKLGFVPVRDLMRMRVGEAIETKLDLQYAICDPGTG